jgi:Ca2+-binding EF-hand superfamily protein
MDSILFFFTLDDYDLVIKKSAVDSINNLVISTGIHELSLDILYEGLSSRSEQGLIEKNNFMNFFNEIFESSNEFDDFTIILDTIFCSFDRNNSGCVDMIELVCGLSVLCEGNKSQKLAFAFNLIDEDKDDLLSSRDLWRFFRSILSVLMNLSAVSNENSLPNSTNLLDKCSVWVVSNLLSWEKAAFVSFEDLSDWYTEVGHNIASFLELMDLKKWLPLTVISSNDNSENKDDHEQEKFYVSISPEYKLIFEGKHSEFVISLSEKTKLSSYNPFVLAKYLESYCTGTGYITTESFRNFVIHGFSEDNFSAMDLLNLFDVLDIDNSGNVPFVEIVTALSVFCSGSKSDKLNFGFQLWGDEDETMHIATVSNMMAIYFKVFIFISRLGEITSEIMTYLSDSVNEKCDLLCDRIEAFICTDMVTFEIFGDWYNSYGFQNSPWLELISLRKWIVDSKSEPQSNYEEQYLLDNLDSEKNDDDSEDDSEDDELSDEESSNEDDKYLRKDDVEAFSIVLYTHHSSFNALALKVSIDTARLFSRFSTTITLDCEAINAFMKDTQDGLLNKEKFIQIKNNLFAASSSMVLKSPSFSFTSFFNAFDRAQEGDFVESTEIGKLLLLLYFFVIFIFF